MTNLKYLLLVALGFAFIAQTAYIISRSLSRSHSGATDELSVHDHQRLSIMNQTLTELNAQLRAIHSIKIRHMRGEFDRSGFAGKAPSSHTQPTIPVQSVNIPSTAVIERIGAPSTANTQVNAKFSGSVIPAGSSSSSMTISSARTMQKKRALLFTMDSISSYEQNSKQGGAAGELIIRHALEDAFKELGVQLVVCRSDNDFDRSNAKSYDIIILDPWTWAAKGWVPKAVIRGLDDKIFILDFFGSKGLRGQGMNIPMNRYLTAFGSPWNSFLGYYMNEDIGESSSPVAKKSQGVIWGKDTKHFTDRVPMLKQIADRYTLVSTATSPVFNHANVRWLGHQTPQSWRNILRESKFLIGLGDPLLGPSAIDAISMGCMFINPVYDKPAREVYRSQHPYAAEKIGEPYVCSYQMKDAGSLMACVDKAMKTDLKPFIPSDFTKTAYIERVASLFDLK